MRADIKDLSVAYLGDSLVTQVRVRAALKDGEDHEFTFLADAEGPLRNALTQLESVLRDLITHRVTSWLKEP